MEVLRLVRVFPPSVAVSLSQLLESRGFRSIILFAAGGPKKARAIRKILSLSSSSSVSVSSSSVFSGTREGAPASTPGEGAAAAAASGGPSLKALQSCLQRGVAEQGATVALLQKLFENPVGNADDNMTVMARERRMKQIRDFFLEVSSDFVCYDVVLSACRGACETAAKKPLKNVRPILNEMASLPATPAVVTAIATPMLQQRTLTPSTRGGGGGGMMNDTPDLSAMSIDVNVRSEMEKRICCDLMESFATDFSDELLRSFMETLECTTTYDDRRILGILLQTLATNRLLVEPFLEILRKNLRDSLSNAEEESGDFVEAILEILITGVQSPVGLDDKRENM